MRQRFLFTVLFGLTTSAFAADRWIPIAGTVNNFPTDARIWNPSQTKEIEITAYFLPVDRKDNVVVLSSGGVKITLPPRQMRVLDDVVTTVFNTSGPGAILFTCPDEFVAGARIYAQVDAAPNDITWRVYDKNNALIATAATPLAAYEVIRPANVTSGFFGAIPGGADLSDAWIAYTATNPIFAYGSVVDNGTTDPTFIPMSQDVGATP